MVDDLDGKLRALGRATDDIRPSDAISDAVVDGLDGPMASEAAPLAPLAAATEGLTPPDDFSDAVMARVMALDAVISRPPVDVSSASEVATSDDSDDDVLLHARRATADLYPSGGFTDAVLAAIADEPALSAQDVPRVSVIELVTGSRDEVLRSARPGLLFAAIAAAACLMLSWYTQRDFDTQLMRQAEIAAEGE